MVQDKHLVYGFHLLNY